LRLFFALWPDADAAARLSGVAGRLSLHAPGRLVAPKNYHVTLAFIGEVADSRLALWREIGQELRAPRCTMTFNALEYWAQSRAIVATAAELPPAVLQLWTQLKDAAGMPLSALRAHVTLARKVLQAPVLQAMSAIIWQVSSVSLVRSETGGAESAYTVVATWPLLYETQNTQ
jgi:RNA 2',3'-cyclic 3'-phosphodiesterase